MPWSRRDLLALLAAPGARLMAQGVASRGVKALPRGKPSGLPFNASFIDVAAAAGLTAPTMYGSPDRGEYILESIGCGAAFRASSSATWATGNLKSCWTLGAPPFLRFIPAVAARSAISTTTAMSTF